jgi:hypothetical protein
MKKICNFALFALVIFITSCDTSKNAAKSATYTGPKKDVDAVTGSLSLHPIVVDIETKETIYSCFLDAKGKTMYITDDSVAYTEFSEYLPARIIPGNLILLEGAMIDPFVLFTEEEFKDLDTKLSKFGVKLNEYKIARIFNYGLTTTHDLDLYKTGQNNQRSATQTNTGTTTEKKATNTRTTTRRTPSVKREWSKNN